MKATHEAFLRSLRCPPCRRRRRPSTDYGPLHFAAILVFVYGLAWALSKLFPHHSQQ